MYWTESSVTSKMAANPLHGNSLLTFIGLTVRLDRETHRKVTFLCHVLKLELYSKRVSHLFLYLLEMLSKPWPCEKSNRMSKASSICCLFELLHISPKCLLLSSQDKWFSPIYSSSCSSCSRFGQPYCVSVGVFHYRRGRSYK